MVKELTGLGLKEAKDVVDSFHQMLKKVFLKMRLKVLKIFRSWSCC
jgi:ribosomal protein L7/L12